MSNSLLTNPVVLDSSLASFKAAVASTLGTNFTIVVTRLRWVTPGASHTLTITDPASGAVLAQLDSDASSADVDMDWTAYPRIWDDFSIGAPAAGKLYVYLR